MQITSKVDFSGVARQLLTDLPGQVPFASALTLTRLAQDGQKAVVAAMPEVFDSPTAFSLRAAAFAPATKAEQVSQVYFKQSAESSGKATNEHLRPGALGSPARSQKKTEYLLTRLGVLPAGWVTVPGKTMPKDSNGNLPGSIYKQIVNVLQLKVNTTRGARAVSKASQKRAGQLGVSAEIFAVVPGRNTLGKGGGWLPSGVYRHMSGGKLQQMLKFVHGAKYTQRLDLPQVVGDAVAKNLSARWNESAASAMKSAR